MGRKPIQDMGMAGSNGAKGATGVTYYIKLPLSLAERVEIEIHARTMDNLRATGTRAEASASGFFREAADALLKTCEERRAKGLPAPKARAAAKRTSGKG